MRAKFTVQMLSGIQKKIYNFKEDEGETPEKEKTIDTPSLLRKITEENNNGFSVIKAMK